MRSIGLGSYAHQYRSPQPSGYPAAVVCPLGETPPRSLPIHQVLFPIRNLSENRRAAELDRNAAPGLRDRTRGHHDGPEHGGMENAAILEKSLLRTSQLPGP